jgi:uncharacterized membrane protein
MGLMGFLYTSLPLEYAVCGWLAALAMLGFAIWKRPFRKLREAPQQHLWLGLVVAISVMWAINAWLDDGPVMHLLGATLMLTLFDWALALVAMGAVIGMIAVIFGSPWQGIGLTFVVLGAVPLAASLLVQRAIAAWLPRHLLVFIVGHGFLAAAIALLAACCATVGVHVALRGGLDFTPLGYWNNAFALAAAEAWFSGMLTAIFAVYRPAWVTSSNQRLYRLDRGPRT